MSSAGSADAPVRVLIVAPAPLADPRSGGIANFICNFVRWAPDDFEIEIVGAAVGGEMPGTRWHTAEIAGRTVRFFPAARLRSGRRSGRIPAKARVAAGMLRHRARLSTTGRIVQVHAPGMELPFLGRHAPTVRVVHNDPADFVDNPGESTWGRLGWLLRPLEARAFARAELFFTSRETRDAYATRLPAHAERMHHVPLAIDPDVFRRVEPGERAVLRERLAAATGQRADAPWLLFAGRLDQQKDPALALRAFAEAGGGTDGAGSPRLLVAGEGRLRAAMERLASELGVADHVAFLGALARADLADAMRAADAFVLSSEFEAGPFVVLEALACGLPVASTRVGEVPHMVDHGSTGWIAADHTPAALAAAMRWALDQPRDAVSARAAASTRSHEVREVLQPFFEAHRRLARSD